MKWVVVSGFAAWIIDRIAVITNRPVTVSVDCMVCVEQLFEITAPRRQAGIAAEVAGQIHFEEVHGEEQS